MGTILARGHLCQIFFYYSLHWLVFLCKLETEAWGEALNSEYALKLQTLELQSAYGLGYLH